MPSLRLSNPFRRGADRPSLKERAASLRATADRVMRQPAPVGLSNVEAELTALAAEYDDLIRASDEVDTLENEGDGPVPAGLANAIDMAQKHLGRRRRAVVRNVMALPASTVLAFGLRARIIEHDACVVLDRGDSDAANLRALLLGLISAAGLSPIPHPDVTTNEIRGWLADPETAPGARRVKA